MEQNYSIKEEALFYISLGLPIIPLCPPQHQQLTVDHMAKCTSPGKTPMIKNWTQWTTTTRENITDWFNTNPYINIGLPMGHLSGIVGIDIDGRDGEVILLAISNGEIPETWEFNTGSGRRLLYGIPKGLNTKKVRIVGQQAHSGLEILCEGQQTVIVPSVHSTGRKYQWKSGHSPREMKLIQAPNWLIEKIKTDTNEEYPTPAQQTGNSVTNEDWQAVLHEGERNDGIARRAGSLVGRGCTREEVTERLLIYNKNYCDPSLSKKEIETIIESIYLREQMKESKQVRTDSGGVKLTFDATPLAKQFLYHQKQNGYLWKYSVTMGLFFKCDETVGPWREMDSEYVKSEIRQSITNKDMGGISKWDKRNYIMECVEAMKSILITGQKENENIFDVGYAVGTNCWACNPLETVNLENGIYNWLTNELHPWNSKVFTTIQLPVKYDSEAQCPNWLKALEEWVNDIDTISFLQEFVGLCLVPDTSFRTAVFLYGTGANGKSMFLDTIRSLFGSSLISIPLHRLTNRFETVYLQNKLVNICGDIDSKYISDTGLLKSMIGGDKLRGEIKHGKSYDFNPVCRFMFSANSIPNVGDKSFGWISRWKFVEFPNTFKVNPAYKIEFSNLFETEKNGILNWAIKGLQRLKNQNQWTQGAKMNQAEEEYREQNDNVAAFLVSFVTKTKYDNTHNTLVINNILHKCYNEWIQNNLPGSQVVSMNEFSKRVLSLGYKKTTRVVEGKNYNVYLGMKVNPEFEEDYQIWLRMGKREVG